ncbi:MAG: mannonate oxidoreductase [Cellulosilyticum sp.]|nr:mannonate oxidoreductase [Cellulosilyticum sp.]
MEHFIKRKNQNKLHQQVIKKQLDRLGWIRIVTFILGVGIIIISNLYQYEIGYFIGATLLVAFIVLVKKYHQVDEKRSYYEAEEVVLNKYEARVGGAWKEFDDMGEAYTDILSRTKDLDIIGRSSLYQYICTAHTPYGKRTLAKALVYGEREKKVLLKRQEAVRELLEDEDFALHLQTISMQMKLRGSKLDSVILDEFIKEAEKQKNYVSRFMKVIGIILPFITLFCFVIALLGFKAQQNYIIVEIGITLQLIISFGQSRKAGELFAPLFAFNDTISEYKAFLEVLEKKSFKSAYLKELQGELFSSGSAFQGLEAMNKLTDSVKICYNFVANVILNGLFLWNIHCMDALSIWNKQYGKEVKRWLEVIGEVETLVSLAVIGRVKTTYSFPTITEHKGPEFEFKNMKHPLIAEEKAVGNDLRMSETTCIITGSNMSGKTTFLRSIGVNLALAYAGGPVVAEEFSTSYMEIFTSMRIEDRVDKGISTFYAELLRIKEMIEYSNRHLPMLVLIDEIFKGTNSADRILGATETIKKLGKPWLNVMVTTHDFELCNLAEENRRKTVNYHFEEYYEDNQIRFDYKLKNDRCKTTNAKYLLKMVGILD